MISNNKNEERDLSMLFSIELDPRGSREAAKLKAANFMEQWHSCEHHGYLMCSGYPVWNLYDVLVSAIY